MERIKAALEKARTDREGGGRSTSKPSGSGASRSVQRPVGRRVANLTDVDAIEYNTSRVVKLDPGALEKNRIIAHSKLDQRSMHYDMLRTQVIQEMHRNKWRTLAVTSPSPSCGKTVTAVNLAFSIAHKMSETVLLVDFDLRKPSVARYLQLPDGPSLVDYLEGGKDLSEVLVNPGVPRITILPNMKPIANASETLASSKVSNLIKEMRNRYDERIVIIDLPPILTIDDALAILPNIDCSLLVVAAGESKASEIRESKRLLESNNLLGTVLNKSDAKPMDYY